MERPNDRIRPLLRLLTPREIRTALLLLGAVGVVAVLEAMAIAAILPFLTALLSPQPSGTGGLLDLARPIYALIGNHPRIILGAAFVLALFAANGASLLVHSAQLRFVYGIGDRIGARLLRTYLGQPYEKFVELESARLQRNVLDESVLIAQGVLRPITQVVSSAAVLLAIFVALLFIAPVAAVAIVTTLGVAYGVFYVSLRKKTTRSGEARFDANRQRFSIVSEALGGAKTTKVHGGESHFITRYEKVSQQHARMHAHNQIRQILPRYIVDTLAIAGLVAIGFFFDATGGDIQPALPTLGLLAFAAYRMVPAFQQILANVTHLRFHTVALGALADDLDQERDIQHRAPGPRLPLRDAIAVSSASVRYPTARQSALEGATIRIRRGESVGLAGKTGSGKSTLADVVLGLRQPTEGNLLVDGVAITDENRAAWQANIGYVPQRIYLANDTLRNNIAFGIPADEIDEARVVEAARLAHVEEFVDRLAQGYHTIIGDQGVRLSGGQQQRIGIARALYRQPSVLVLDEATSDLDLATEDAITRSLEALRGRMTILVIAHRLATIEGCDRIYVLHDGRIVAEGSYQELIRTDPSFQALVKEPA